VYLHIYRIYMLHGLMTTIDASVVSLLFIIYCLICRAQAIHAHSLNTAYSPLYAYQRDMSVSWSQH